MNLLQIQDQLKGLPDNALINYVQNPTGEVPTYLALSELERRKTMRDQYQAEQAQAPKTTVAQDLTQTGGLASMMGAPQPTEPPEVPQPTEQSEGVAGMDTGGMFQEKNFAGGGIVAFDKGDVVFARELSQAEYDALPTEQKTAYDRQFFNKVMDRQGYKPFAAAADIITSPYHFGANILEKGLNAIDFARMGRMAGIYAPDVTSVKLPRLGKGSMTPYYDQIREAERVDTTKPMYKGQTNAPYKPSAADRIAMSQIADQALNQPSMMDVLMNTVPDMPAAKAEKAPVGVAPSAVGKAGAGAGAASAGLKSLYTPPEDLSGEYEKQLRPTTSAETAMDRYKALLGEDTGRAKLEERLASMEERAGKEAERAPWMALARAGLGMAAGKSPFALQNIAAGGTEGLKDYAESQDRLAKAEERRFDIQSRIAQAQRAEQVAAATYGLNSEERDQAHNETVRLQQLGYKANRAQDTANKQFEAAKFGIEEQRKGRELDITQKHYDQWYQVNLAQAEKALQGIEKQAAGDRTKILNNLLDEAVRQQKAAQDAIDDKGVAAIQARIDAIQKKMFELTGVEVSDSTTTPSGPRAKPLSAFGK